jgi:hypothetical protein
MADTSTRGQTNLELLQQGGVIEPASLTLTDIHYINEQMTNFELETLLKIRRLFPFRGEGLPQNAFFKP